MTIIPENLPSTIYAQAWAALYNAFGEQMQDKELELMDNILQSIVADEQERIKWLSEQGEANEHFFSR